MADGFGSGAKTAWAVSVASSAAEVVSGYRVCQGHPDSAHVRDGDFSSSWPKVRVAEAIPTDGTDTGQSH